MPTGMSGLFRNTYGARSHEAYSRGDDMKRLERAIGIFRKMRKACKGDTTVCMLMNTNDVAKILEYDVAEILGWLEELKEYRAMGLDEFRGQGKEKYIDGIGYVIET